MAPCFTLRRLLPADAAAYRELRLESLRSDPASFGAAWEDEAAQPLDWFAARLGGGLVQGGFLPEGRLAGVAGLLVSEAVRQRHKAVLWGMFVRPEARGRGLAAGLVEALLAAAPPQVEEVRLTVMASNVAAIRLYARLGFMRFALEPRALKIDGRYHDDAWMVRRCAPARSAQE